ncbi:Sorting nexin-1 [Nibea albiflora]|uniref:Sorting nexin-1 n=1 Tax=Nibea albiflora TaxID=240163 RepID=A0ACB7EG73_NIBAL|nr:Sorting nexin-1 [Nibea albiflora]
MAASSDRDPPPFPAAEEPGAGPPDMADGDSDEGEDIFVCNSNPVAAVSRGVSQPDRVSGEPPDLFSEEDEEEEEEEEEAGNTPAKSNGVHSDDDNDLFAEAHVELSTDKPGNSDRKELSTSSSGLRPASSFTQSPAAMQPPSLEQLEDEEAKDSFDVDVAVTNPEKVGDGMNAYVAYKVSTRTSLPMFRSKAFTVRRRYSDFLGLYEKLSVKQSLQGCIVPPPPEKSVLPRAVSTQTLSGAGFLKMINRASDAVNKMTIKMNESDTWFEDKFQEVENEEQQLRKLHALVDSLVNHRKELCGNTAVFAKSMAMLGNSEDNTALSRALSQLAEVEDKMEQLHQEQAASDFFIFEELLADYIRLLGAMRGCFDQRIRAWQRWQEAQGTLQKKREAEAKLLWANKPDKLQQAKDEITEWESRVTQYERDFDRVGMTVRKEVLRFEKEKAKDFKSQIIKYLEAMLQSQQRVVHLLLPVTNVDSRDQPVQRLLEARTWRECRVSSARFCLMRVAVPSRHCQ